MGQLKITYGAVDHGAVRAFCSTGGIYHIFYYRLALGVRQAIHHRSLMGQFKITYGAVDHGAVRAFCSTGGIYHIFYGRLTFGVAQGSDLFLLNQSHTANGALLTVGQAGIFTGSSLAGYGLLRMRLSGNYFLRTTIVSTKNRSSAIIIVSSSHVSLGSHDGLVAFCTSDGRLAVAVVGFGGVLTGSSYNIAAGTQVSGSAVLIIGSTMYLFILLFAALATLVVVAGRVSVYQSGGPLVVAGSSSNYFDGSAYQVVLGIRQHIAVSVANAANDRAVSRGAGNADVVSTGRGILVHLADDGSQSYGGICNIGQGIASHAGKEHLHRLSYPVNVAFNHTQGIHHIKCCIPVGIQIARHIGQAFRKVNEYLSADGVDIRLEVKGKLYLFSRIYGFLVCFHRNGGLTGGLCAFDCDRSTYQVVSRLSQHIAVSVANAANDGAVSRGAGNADVVSTGCGILVHLADDSSQGYGSICNIGQGITSHAGKEHLHGLSDPVNVAFDHTQGIHHIKCCIPVGIQIARHIGQAFRKVNEHLSADGIDGRLEVKGKLHFISRFCRCY